MSWVFRADVRVRRAGDRVYVCSSDGPPLRLTLPGTGTDLPAGASASLRRRGLLVDADEPLRRHPSYVGLPYVGLSHSGQGVGGIQILGTDPMSTRVAALLDTALGQAAAAQPAATDLGSRAETTGTGIAEPGVAVVGLAAGDDELTTAARAGRVVVHLLAGARLFWAVLRPPHTACPLCVAVRIRATRADPELGALGLDVALGITDEPCWPTFEAAAGIVTHQALRALTGPPVDGADGTDEAGSADGAGELVELDMDTVTASTHPLLHTPHCPACAERVASSQRSPAGSTPSRRSPAGSTPSQRSPAGSTPSQLTPAAQLARSWAGMQRAIDPLTGIVSGLAVITPDRSGGTPEPTDTECTVAWAQGGTDTRWFSSVRASTVGGSTKDDPLAARVCAVGEILERYAAGIHRPQAFVRASLVELGDSAVDPRELPLGSEREYALIGTELAPYHPELVIDWVAGSSLVTGETRYLPAAAVYVPYRAPSRHERLLHPNSTGLAAGSSGAHATLGGLLEVVERDAAALTWYNRLRLPTWDLATLPDGLPDSSARRVLGRIAARGVRLLAKDITTDLGVPSVLLLARFEADGHPVALCSFRSDLDPHGCLLGAGQELEHLLAMYRRAGQQGLTTVADPGSEPRDIWDLATYYCHRDRVGALDFLADGPLRPVPPPDREDCEADPHEADRSDADRSDTGYRVPDHRVPGHGGPDHHAAVAEIVARLAGAGHDPVTVDITPVDVAECGVRVVRAVVPGLQPVSFHARFRHLGGRRVYAAPVRMGLLRRELTEDELNPDPIPLG